MTTSQAYQAGYASVLEKLAVSVPWIEQRAARGAVQRIKKYDFHRESLIPAIADNTLGKLNNTAQGHPRQKREALHAVLSKYNKGLQEAVLTDPGRLRVR